MIPQLKLLDVKLRKLKVLTERMKHLESNQDVKMLHQAKRRVSNKTYNIIPMRHLQI